MKPLSLFGIIRGGGVVVGNTITEAVVLRTDRPISINKLDYDRHFLKKSVLK